MEAAVGAAAAAAAGAVGLEAAGGASAAPANGHRWGGGREPCTCRPPPPRSGVTALSSLFREQDGLRSPFV